MGQQIIERELLGWKRHLRDRMIHVKARRGRTEITEQGEGRGGGGSETPQTLTCASLISLCESTLATAD